MATKRRIAEQCQRILGGKPQIQELMLYCNQAYATVVQKNWWMAKNEGLSDINGNYIYAFDNNAISLDVNKNLYYSLLPSSYLGNIPHELGINHVSYQESLTHPFIRLANGYPALFQGLQSSNFDGYDTFFVENDKIYLPTINTTTACDRTLLIKLVVALDGIDDQTNIEIPPDIEAQIIELCVSMYSQKQNEQVVASLPVAEGKKAF